MALQVQATLHTTRTSPSLLAPTANPTLLPLSNPYALKSSFLSASLNLLLHPNKQHLLIYGPPRFSMRVASKQSYICRDCGFIFFHLSPLIISWSFSLFFTILHQKSISYYKLMLIIMFAGIFTMRGLLLRNCLINTSALVI